MDTNAIAGRGHLEINDRLTDREEDEFIGPKLNRVLDGVAKTASEEKSWVSTRKPSDESIRARTASSWSGGRNLTRAS